ncbi:MAG: restriction endonuclease subunit S [Lachnospiraceae bacterium]
MEKHREKLISLCEIQYGYAFDSKQFSNNNAYIPLVRIRDVKRGFSETFYSGEYPEEYVLHAGDILVGMDGEFNIARWKSRNALLNQRVCKITAKKDIDDEYLRFALAKELKKIESRTAFATVKHLSAKELNKLELEIPSYKNQKLISEILTKLEKIICFYERQLEQLNQLIKSRFVEMFGDPITNPKSWKMVTIGDIVTEVRYGTSRPAVEGGEYPYLRMNNLTYDGYLDLTDLKRIDIPESEIEKYIVHKGDVLFNRTNSVELVGKTCVFEEPEDMIIAGYIIRVRLKSIFLPVVLSCFMNTDALKGRLKNMAKGAVNQANINAQELQAIEVYMPPLNLQNQFSEFVHQVDKLKVEAQGNLEKVQLLFDSLMQQYFG